MLPVLQATQARLDALEADNDAGDALAADSDDEEVVIESDDEGGRGQGWQLRVGEARKASRRASAQDVGCAFTKLRGHAFISQPACKQ